MGEERKGKKKIDPEVKKAVDKLIEAKREELYEIFAEETFNLTFDQREKLIDSKLDKQRCEVLEKHIEEDPDGIARSNNKPQEVSKCICGGCATLCRDEKGNPKIFERDIKTKRGPVTVKEYGYYCSKCRKIFFPSEKKAHSIQRKLQP